MAPLYFWAHVRHADRQKIKMIFVLRPGDETQAKDSNHKPALTTDTIRPDRQTSILAILEDVRVWYAR